MLTELRATVRAVLAAIAESVAASREMPLALGYSRADPLLRVISSLAAGSDQLITQEALALGYELQCVLPFQANEYGLDFSGAEALATYEGLRRAATSVLELDGMREQAAAAYERAGRTIVTQSDLLVAIWNGEPAVGRGGTAEVIEKALARGMPVVWIHASPPYEYQLIVGDAGPTPGTASIAILKDRIRQLVAPPIEDGIMAQSAYFAGSLAHTGGGRFFRIFRTTLLIGSGRGERTKIEEGCEQFESPDAIARHTPIPEPFAADYRRADALAEHFSGLYRDSFVANSLMAVAAVAMALLEGIRGYWWARGIELLLLGSILLNIRAGRRGCWHERWLSFRILSEALRQAGLLYPLGRTLQPFRVPAHGEEEDPKRFWVNWLARARVREAGLVSTTLNASSLESYRRTLVARMREQLRYHAMNGRSNAVLARRIRAIGLWTFFAAFVAVAVHALTDLARSHAKIASTWPGLGSRLSTYGASVISVTRILDTFLPAVGAAIAGVGGQAEFGRISDRSRAMEHRLRALIARALEAQPTSDACGLIAEEASGIMTTELLDWHVIFRDKGIEPPV